MTEPAEQTKRNVKDDSVVQKELKHLDPLKRALKEVEAVESAVTEINTAAEDVIDSRKQQKSRLIYHIAHLLPTSKADLLQIAVLQVNHGILLTPKHNWTSFFSGILRP